MNRSIKFYFVAVAEAIKHDQRSPYCLVFSWIRKRRSRGREKERKLWQRHSDGLKGIEETQEKSFSFLDILSEKFPQEACVHVLSSRMLSRFSGNFLNPSKNESISSEFDAIPFSSFVTNKTNNFKQERLNPLSYYSLCFNAILYQLNPLLHHRKLLPVKRFGLLIFLTRVRF